MEIAKIEEELVKEGMEKCQLRRLCDVHVTIIKDQMERQAPQEPPNEPVNILMEEHKIMLDLAEKLKSKNTRIQQATDIRYVQEDIHQVEHIAQDFADSEKHFAREENVLFPLLEKHGVTEPPSIMWMEHTDIKDQKKKLHTIVGELEKAGFETYKQQLDKVTQLLGNLLQSHFLKKTASCSPRP